MAKIQSILAREILDSRGNPTVQVFVELEGGIRTSAAVPSGASTGGGEACELRDGGVRYGGKGVLTAVKNVNTEIVSAVRGQEANDQKKIDAIMIELDGTKNKSRLGANAILGVSLAVCRAASLEQKKPLFAYIHDSFFDHFTPALPIPMFNILNGGQHADSGLCIQEFKVVPFGIHPYAEQLRAGSEIFQTLKSKLSSAGYSTGVGDEGGFAPKLKSNEHALQFIYQAIESAGYDRSTQVGIGLDTAANSFYKSDGDVYELSPEKISYKKEQIVGLYLDWAKKFNIVSIEDGLHEEDWDGWKYFSETAAREIPSLMLIGDDLLVTNPQRVALAIERKSCNSVLIKPNQIGSLSETIETILLAKSAGMKTVISHRSGETSDTFIADLAVASASEYMKTGAPSRGERVCKYNRLLEIEDFLLGNSQSFY